jgi:hypothetical protein
MSTVINHTPGPWETSCGMVQTVREHECKITGCGVHIPIALMDRTPGNGTVPTERDANAHLIAQAPELLKFAKLVRDFFTNDSAGHAKYLREQAEIVIEKAEYR